MSLAHLLDIDRNKSKPLYRQIAEQISIQIGDGRLPAGTQLPTVRQLAELLQVTRVTAQNAYSELQSGGWVESTVGRGTFVTASPQTQDLITALTRRITPDSVMGDIERIGKIAGLRSFAYAEPDPAFYPVDDFWYSVNSQSANLTSLMQYGAVQGDSALRVAVAAMLVEQGINVMPDDLLVTTGVSQGLALVTQCLTAPGSCVAVEQPTYLGLLHILTTNGVQPINIPLDSEGLRLDVLEQVVAEHHPRFLYTSPNYQNPTGTCMSEQRRRDLLALAEQNELIIVEDDIYGQLAFSDEIVAPLKAMDKQDRVIYLSSFSKVLMPGLRVGFMVAPAALRDQLISIRQAFDLSGSPLLQRALANFLQRGRLKAHLRRVLPRYRERHDAMQRALQNEMPNGTSWTRAKGGLCLWVTLRPGQSRSDLYHQALEHGVAFTPGDVFLTGPSSSTHMRLCFGSQSPESIREGMRILGQLLRDDTLSHRIRRTVRDLPLV